MKKVSKNFNNGKIGWNEIIKYFKYSTKKPKKDDFHFILWLTLVLSMSAFLIYFCLI